MTMATKQEEDDDGAIAQLNILSWSLGKISQKVVQISMIRYINAPQVGMLLYLDTRCCLEEEST